MCGQRRRVIAGQPRSASTAVFQPCLQPAGAAADDAGAAGMMLWKVALRSLLTRKLALSLVILAMALSLSALLLGRSLSQELRSSFNSSVSGTDLIVAARSHPLQVVLYSVFRLGTPTQALSAERWQ